MQLTMYCGIECKAVENQRLLYIDEVQNGSIYH